MASQELRVEPLISEISRVTGWLESCCVAEGLAEDATLQIALALEEAVTNVINHAFAGLPPPYQITVRIEITRDRIAAEVIDNGHPFDPTSMPDPDITLPLEGRPPGGMGIHLIRSMMDRMQYRRTDGNNFLRLEQARR